MTIYNKTYYMNELRNKLEIKMKMCSAILILAGVYATYSDAINMEIEIARKLNKPIIAIEPFGSEKTSQIVKMNATRIVKWNTNSIVSTIRELCR